MNTRKTLIMAVILLIAIVYLTQSTLPKREREEASRRVFSALKGSELSTVDITRRLEGDKVESFSLKRLSASTPSDADKVSSKNDAQESEPDRSNADFDLGSWDLTGVRGAVLDDEAVKGFLKGIKDLEIEGPLDEGALNKDISVYGLDKPALTISLHRPQGGPQGGITGASDEDSELAFGKLNQYLSKRYVKVSGRSGVFLAPDSVFDGLNKGKSDLRSKSPVKFEVADVREALITSSQGRIKISQPAVGEWRVVEPIEADGSQEDVNELFNALKGVQVAEFIDVGEEGYGNYGFSSPRVNIHIQLREGMEPSQMAFSLANRRADTGGADELYLQVSGVDSIYKLANNPSDSLVKSLTALRERRILKLETGGIKSVASSGKGIVATTIEAQDLLWKVNGKDSDPMFVDQYLRDLGALKAKSFPDTVPANAFDEPFLVLSIVLKDPEAKPITLTVGGEVRADDPGEQLSTPADKPAEGDKDLKRYVKSSKSDQVYIIRDVEAKRIVPHEEALIPKATPTPAVGATVASAGN
jgi:hypothetical protein